MNDKLHIILTGDSGKGRTLLFSKKKLRIFISLSLLSILCLCFGTIVGVSFFKENKNLDSSVASLATELEQTTTEKNLLVAQVTMLQKENTNQALAHSAEKDLLLKTAISDLSSRSQLIENVISNIGINIDKIPDIKEKNSGGPFVPVTDSSHDDLMFKADSYLEILRTLPIGRPVPGRITSKYGKRKDPVNGKRGFHTGIDMRGKRGQEIKATADGRVTRAFRNGGFGLFVEIDHGNGYKSVFAHMKKYLVKRGDEVVRGQLIGYVGNTGRSTGPHLHYEVTLNDKTVNPAKLISVSKLIVPAETKK